MQRVVMLMAMAAIGVSGPLAMAGEELLVYFGTYSGPKSQGIYVSRLDLDSGKCTPPELAAAVKNPSFLAIHPTRPLLVSVSEISDLDGKPTGGVSSFTLDARSGKLALLNQQSSQGAGPCHVVVDRSGSTVLVANYGGGSVASFPILDDGKLGPASSFIQHTGHSVNKDRQAAPHAHSINVSVDNRFAVAADLGLDQLLVYRLNQETSTLTPHDPPAATVPPGSGPRHFAFHPSGQFGYVINEILCTVTAFAFDAQQGRFKELQTITTLPQGETLRPEYSTAEVQVHPSGKFLYGSNRGHHSISVFAIDPKQGTLTWVENVSTRGKTPRGFGIDPTGQYLLAGNQDSHTVVPFRIDGAIGKLTPTGETLEVGTPVCVKFVKRQPATAGR